MNLRALFHKPSDEHFPVPSDQKNPREQNALQVFQSGLLGDFPAPADRQALSL
jgi:hypothetical protein